jgi:TorA maturation chaperone TorD
MPGPELTAWRDLCALASRLLAAETDAPLLARLRAMSPDDTGLSLIDPAVAELPQQEALTELAVEFCRLFIGPRPVCPPYPAAYGRGAALAGLTEGRFADFLARHRLRESVGCGPKLARDHLAIQLGTLAHLYHAVHSGRTNGTPAARAIAAIGELVGEHLLPWADDFAAALSASARLSPYSTLGSALRAFVAELVHERDRVDRLPPITVS